MKRTLLTVLVTAVAGCATSKIQPVAMDKGDFGKPPKNYEKILNQHWDKTLKDPASLKIKSISRPVKAYTYKATEKPHGYDLYSDVTFTPVYGYKVCAKIMAKNSYGAYGGWKTKTYFFDNKGRFVVPVEYSRDMMNGMHRTGSFTPEMRLITQGC